MVTLDQCGWLGPDAAVTVRPAADDLIEHAFVLDMRTAEQASWIVLPDPSAHVLVQKTLASDGSSHTSVSVVGARSVAIDVSVAAREWTVGLRLRPGALPLVTGFPAADFSDRGFPATDVWGARGARLVRALEHETDPLRLVGAVETFLQASNDAIRHRDWKARALSRALQVSHGTVGVADVADRLGVSGRSLRTVGHDLIGLAPKRHARIERLYQAIRAVSRKAEPRWSRAAIAAGYTDQSHLTREFRDLLGETPARFHARGRRDADSYKRLRGTADIVFRD